MNELVTIRKEQATTTSLEVAEVFEKRHDHVLRDIENLKKDVPNFGQMFEETYEPDIYGRSRRVIYMNRDGFTLLAMGFTGNKALPQTPEEKLKLTMEAATHLDQRLSTVEDEITDMKENAEIDSTQRYQLLQERNHRVMSIVGGKNSNYYLEHKANKVYAKMFADLKKVFKVPRYNALPKKDFERASKFIKNWYPDVVLKDEIDKANAQQRLEL